MQIISHSFTWGLLLGLLLVGMTWRLMRKDIVQLRSEKKRIEVENKELQGHLNTQLKINSKGNESLEKQMNELKEQNETLRMNLNALNHKPGKAELRQLSILESAVGVMREQIPGFAQAWEKAIRDAESNQEAAESGFKKLIRKVMPTPKPAKTLDIEDTSFDPS